MLEFRADTRWGMHKVAASDMWSFEKLLKITFIVRKTSSLIVAVDHKSLSNAAE